MRAGDFGLYGCQNLVCQDSVLTRASCSHITVDLNLTAEKSKFGIQCVRDNSDFTFSWDNKSHYYTATREQNKFVDTNM